MDQSGEMETNDTSLVNVAVAVAVAVAVEEVESGLRESCSELEEQ